MNASSFYWLIIIEHDRSKVKVFGESLTIDQDIYETVMHLAALSGERPGQVVSRLIRNALQAQRQNRLRRAVSRCFKSMLAPRRSGRPRFSESSTKKDCSSPWSCSTSMSSLRWHGRIISFTARRLSGWSVPASNGRSAPLPSSGLMVADAHHVFLDALGPVSALNAWPKIVGHQQVTDAYLIHE
jgi:hypothetical protein